MLLGLLGIVERYQRTGYAAVLDDAKRLALAQRTGACDHFVRVEVRGYTVINSLVDFHTGWRALAANGTARQYKNHASEMTQGCSTTGSSSAGPPRRRTCRGPSTTGRSSDRHDVRSLDVARLVHFTHRQAALQINGAATRAVFPSRVAGDVGRASPRARRR